MIRIRAYLARGFGVVLLALVVAGCEPQSVRTEKEVRRTPSGKRVVTETKTVETGGDAGMEERTTHIHRGAEGRHDTTIIED